MQGSNSLTLPHMEVNEVGTNLYSFAAIGLALCLQVGIGSRQGPHPNNPAVASVMAFGTGRCLLRI